MENKLSSGRALHALGVELVSCRMLCIWKYTFLSCKGKGCKDGVLLSDNSIYFTWKFSVQSLLLAFVRHCPFMAAEWSSTVSTRGGTCYTNKFETRWMWLHQPWGVPTPCWEKAITLLQEGEKLSLRQKSILMADRSEHRWVTVAKYEEDELANNSDEKWLFRVEQSWEKDDTKGH